MADQDDSQSEGSSASEEADQAEKSRLQDEDAQQRTSPSGTVVYKAILTEGEEELERPSSALFWSGLAAGLSMGFSFIAEGLLRTYLPETHWSQLVWKFGYSVGFLIVILGRQQLFTENTLTPILPLLKQRNLRTLGNVGRLWGVVLVANLIGAAAIGFAAVRTNAVDESIRRTLILTAHEAMSGSFGTTLWRGVFAGWLIALMVWLLPFAEVARVWVIIIITYIVGLGNFSHVVAGAVEVFALAAAGEKSWGNVLNAYILPTLIGNIIGGVTLVAAINHAQVIAGGKGEDI